MNSKPFTRSVSKKLLPLVMTLFLAGCLQTTTTHIAATESKIVAGVCKVWVPVTYSSRDTLETQLKVRANDAARDTYCKN